MFTNVPPRKIGTNCNVACDSDTFYNIRRLVLKENLAEDLNQLLNPLANEGQQVLVTKDHNGNLIHLTIIEWEVAESEYVQHVAIVDDIAMTNQYVHPIEVIIVIDQESHIQPV